MNIYILITKNHWKRVFTLQHLCYVLQIMLPEIMLLSTFTLALSIAFNGLMVMVIMIFVMFASTDIDYLRSNPIMKTAFCCQQILHVHAQCRHMWTHFVTQTLVQSSMNFQYSSHYLQNEINEHRVCNLCMMQSSNKIVIFQLFKFVFDHVSFCRNSCSNVRCNSMVRLALIQKTHAMFANILYPQMIITHNT